MKILLLSILLSLELSINTFNNQAVIDYARKWCNSTNPYYNYYEEDDSSNFVTQSLIRGGIDFFGCKMDSKGSIREYNDLTKCLRDMGWYTYRFVTKEFKAGYPVLYGKMIAIATYVNGTTKIKIKNKDIIISPKIDTNSIIKPTIIAIIKDARTEARYQ